MAAMPRIRTVGLRAYGRGAGVWTTKSLHGKSANGRAADEITMYHRRLRAAGRGVIRLGLLRTRRTAAEVPSDEDRRHLAGGIFLYLDSGTGGTVTSKLNHVLAGLRSLAVRG